MKTRLPKERFSRGFQMPIESEKSTFSGQTNRFLAMMTFMLAMFFTGTSYGQIAATGLLSPTSNVQTGVSNPANAYSSNDSDASFAENGDVATYQDFSFPVTGNVNVVGIEVLVEAANSGDRPMNVSLTWNDGSTFTTEKAMPTLYPNDAFRQLGGLGDTWGRTWTSAELANANFGVRLRVPAAATGTITVDHIRVRIYYANNNVQVFTSNGTFNVPAGVSNVTVEAWGSGGGGNSAANAVGGGGGGAYTRGTIPGLTSGNSIAIVVGAGGVTGAAGNFSRATFSSNVINANGGSAGGNRAGGAGATATAVTGIIEASFAGGAGGAGRATSSGGANEAGGGGGGSAFTNAGGSAGTVGGSDDDNLTPGGSGTGYGGGGASAEGNPNATAGNFPGGGGGGRGESTSTSAAGAAGVVVVTWCPTFAITSTAANTPLCVNGSGNSTITLTASPTVGLPVGTYTVTYNRSLPSATGLTASLTVTSEGTGIFTASGLTTAGNATITVTNIASTTSSCNSNISTGNVSNTIVVNGLPTAAAGSNLAVCYISGSIAISAGSSASNFATLTWTTSGTGTFTDANSTTTATYTPSATDLSAGSVTLTLTATPKAPCSGNATSQKTLTLAQQPTATAGGSATICTTQTHQVSGASSSNGTVLWTENGAGSLTGANTLTPIYTPAAGDAGNTVTLTMTVSNAPCTAATATYTISVVGAATATAGTALTLCETAGSVNVTSGATSANNAGVTWSSSGTGSFANATSMTTATYTPSIADYNLGSVIITLTATGNSPCGNATSNKTLTLYKQPTATAGGSATICVTQTHQVSGATSSNGTIAWTENGAGSLAAANTLTPTYTPAAGDAGNTVTLTMTVSNGTCTAATATYTISVVASATANAGTALTLCETAGSVNVTAGSTSTNNSGVTWTSSGTGSFANANSMTTATYTPSVADFNLGSVTITLTATGNSPCGNATSNKTLTLYKQPTATAGGSQTICQNQSATVSGATSSNGTILWTENGAGSIQAGTQTTLTPIYNAAAGDAGNTVTLTLTVSNGTCTPATATYTVTVLALPTAAAGSAFATCANSGAINVTAGASASNNSGVLWSSSGTGTFTDANSLTTAMYTPSPADITAGSVTLTLTALGNGSCNNATSNKVLTILPIPVATGVAICQGTASMAMTSSTACPDQPAVTLSKYPASAANSGTGTAWTNPGNVISDNNSGATLAGSTSGTVTSQPLLATGFAFGIPTNATVRGIQCAIGRSRNNPFLSSGDARDSSLRLLKAGTAVGTNMAATGVNWPASEAEATYGGNTNLWGSTWTAAEVNANNFGVAFVALVTSGIVTARTANVDYLELTVTYTVPGDLNWYTVSSGGSIIGSGSSFNPVGVAGSGLPNTNTPGTTTYYVECSNIAGCRTPVTYTINALPVVSFTGLASVYCQDAAAVTLTANQAGGTFSGAGITNNGNGTASFNPVTAGVGPHAITYSYTDGNTCVNSVVNNTNVNANVTYYADSDSDGFGDINTPLVSCIGTPGGFVLDNTDCDDNDNTKHMMYSFFLDNDGDTFGAGNLVMACAVNGATPPSVLYVLNNTDCDDTDNTKNASFDFYVDSDSDTYGTGTAVSLCAINGATPPLPNYAVNNTDCNDSNAAIFMNSLLFIDVDGDNYDAGTQVVCHGVTAPVGFSFTTNGSDCNDNNAAMHMTFGFYADTDGDTFGAGSEVQLCAVNANTPPLPNYSINNLDCNDSSAAVNPNIGEVGYNLIDDDCDGSIDEGFPPKVTQLQGAFCNATLSTIDTQIVANLVSGAQGYRWRITTLTGPNANQVQTLDTALRVMKLTQLTTYAFNTQYKVEVAVYFSGFLQAYTAACNINTPAATTQLTSCGGSMSLISDAIRANIVPYATGYRFRIVDPLNPVNSQVIDRSIRDFKMNLVTDFVVQYGKTYNVDVAVKNTDGTYMAYGNVCTVTTPIFPTTSLQDSQCDDYIVTDNAVQLYAISYPGVIAYVFQLTGPGLPSEGVEVTHTSRSFTMADFPGAIGGASYNVRVRMVFHASDPIGPFGKVCTVAAPAVSKQAVVTTVAFDAVAYPNPFAENFNIEVTTAMANDINVKVYDMTGRLLENKEVKSAQMQSVSLGDNYPSGVYNVIVSQGESVKTLRVIKR